MIRTIAWLGGAILLTAIACDGAKGVKVGADREGSDNVEAAGLNEACFVQLHPDRVEDGRLTGVSYQHGRCVGAYKALNKFSFQDHVWVVDRDETLADATKSALYVEGDSVSVEDDGGRRRVVGRLEESGESARLVLESGTEFALEVQLEDGSSLIWQYGDDRDDVVAERIVLYVPGA